jgi:hypothetical protein
MGSAVVAPTLAIGKASGGAVSTTNWLPFALLATPLIGATFLSKFAIPPFGKQGIGISLFILLGAVIAGTVGGGMRIEPRRLTLYFMLVGSLGLIQILQPEAFSPLSLLLLVAVHLPYVVTVPHSDDGDRIVELFLGIATILALLGIAQYGLQFFVDPSLLFPIENFVPDTLIVQHFNHQAAMEYGSHEFRANGVFMLEPSFFSQLLAVAVIAELCTRARMTRLAIFGLALIASFSGTGIVVLAICLPLCLVAQRRWGLLLTGVVAAVAIVLVHEYVHEIRILSRAGEFSSTHSSGYSRFVAGFYLFEQFLWHEPWRALFGYGAGAFTNYASRGQSGGDEMALFKIVIEFGLVGAVAYFGFLFCCLFYSPAPRVLILAVAITYFLNGIYTPFAHGLALSLLLWKPVPDNERRGHWLGKWSLRNPTISPVAAQPALNAGGRA